VPVRFVPKRVTKLPRARGRSRKLAESVIARISGPIEGACTKIDNASVNTDAAASLTVKIELKLPRVAAIPVRSAASPELVRAIPGGKELVDHVYGGVPPLAIRLT
jgi:hypothetical protein